MPFGAEATAEVVSFDKEVYDLKEHNIKHKIIPMQPSVSKSDDPAAVEFEYDAEAYQKNAFSSHELATVEITQEPCVQYASPALWWLRCVITR
ncbi:MAG: hypothetical protein U5L09_19165 [Bacteroidales bacterium]|nr:hypothetical protein [Bacteroidales bacterium]